MVIDAFMWSYEREAVEIRVKNLSGIVDAHLAVQADNTFRGDKRKTQPLNIPGVQEVIVHIPDNLPTWKKEAWLRDEVLRQAVLKFGKDHVYIISDGDEIPNPWAILEARLPQRLMTDYRSFYANWRAIDHVLENQPTIGKLRHYRLGAQHARTANWKQSKLWGWHLSSLGNTSKEKLSTYSHDEYDNEQYKSDEALNMARESKRDFLNRFDLEYTADIPIGVPKHLIRGEYD